MNDLTLDDLRVVKYEKTQSPFHDAEGFRPAVVYTRPMTPQDLAAILASLTDEQLAELGGERRGLWSWNEKGTRKVMEPGTYLVVPIPEDS